MDETSEDEMSHLTAGRVDVKVLHDLLNRLHAGLNVTAEWLLQSVCPIEDMQFGITQSDQ